METQIQSLHFTADGALKEFIYDKVQDLDKAYDRIEDCIVVLRIDNDNKDRNKVVEIDLGIPGKRVFASDRTESFEQSAVQAVEQLKRQLIRRKEKLAENVDPHFFIGENPAI